MARPSTGKKDYTLSLTPVAYLAGKVYAESNNSSISPLMDGLLIKYLQGKGVLSDDPIPSIHPEWEREMNYNERVANYFAAKKSKDATAAVHKPGDTAKGFFLRELGHIPAGAPFVIEEAGRVEIEIPFDAIPEKLRKGAYVLRVNGKSMEPTIKDGSRIVIVKKEPKPGDIVVGHLPDDGVTLKKYVVEKGKHILRSLNPKYKDILPRDKLEVQGVYFCTL